MNKLMRWKYKIIEIAPWIIAAFAALSSHWAAHAIEKLVHGFSEKVGFDFSFNGIGYIVFFCLMLYFLIKVRTAFFRPRTRYMRGEKPEKREHLIIFLSHLYGSESFNCGIPEGLTIEGDFTKDFQSFVEYKKKSKWQWEMPLRAIGYHIENLKTVTLICSKESILQVEWFQKILKKYEQLKGVNIKILVKSNSTPMIVNEFDVNIHKAWNFEDFDDLSHALIFLIKDFHKEGISEEEVMLDFTGGQKVTSVVAAAITFNRKIKSQYVQTNSPWDVLSYDILLGYPETGSIEIEL